MEFDTTVLEIQKKIRGLNNEFGNLQEVEITAEQLAPCLEKWRCFTQKLDDGQKRKIQLYLVLNTNFSFHDIVEVSDDVAHLADTAPLLSTKFLVNLIRGCDLLSYAYETMSFADPVLAIHYVEALLQERHQISALDYLEEFFSVIHSMFAQLSNCHKPYIVHRLASEFIKLLDSLPEHLCSKLANLNSNDKLKVAGVLAKKLIELVLFCMQSMHEPSKDLKEYYLKDMYPNFDYSQWSGSKDLDLLSCFERAVNECQNNMKAVDLERWMRWVEVGGQTDGKSLQMEIGEAAYRCVQFEPKPNNSVMHLSAILSGFKMKPVTEIDLADLGKVISKLENSETQNKEWLLALLKKEGCLKEERTVDLIAQHSTIWDLDVVSALIQLARNNNGNSERINTLAMEAFKALNMQDQKSVICSFFEENGVNEYFMLPNFETEVTTTLNMSSYVERLKEKWLPQYLFLSLQSPKRLVEKSVSTGISTRGQGSLIAIALSEVSSLCYLPFKGSTLLLDSLKTAMKKIDPTKSHLAHFVKQLEEKKLITAVTFLKQCLLPALKSDLSSYRIPQLLLWIQLLKLVLMAERPELVDLEGKISLAVLLAVLAEILQRASWVLGKFKHAESLLRAETVLLVRCLALKYANSVANPKDKELLWLQSGLLRLTSHNRAHFSAIWTRFNQAVPSMNMGSLLLSKDAMYQRSGMPPGGPDQLLSPLLILLPSCCTPEWRLLITSLAKVLSTYNTTDQEPEEADEREEIKMLPDAIRLVVTALMLQALMLSQQQPPDDANYSNECALACLENSVRNLGIIMKEEWLPKLNDVSDVENGIGVVRQVALLLRSLPSAIASSCSLALSGVLQEAHEVLLLKAGMQTELATWCVQELALSLALLPSRETRQSLARKLLIEPALAQI
ncbi:Hypothetical predicted protein [Cloeon dipterum]|uniref:Uncharacterized protein n=1 Tax=Cloeon dipterum TaxID=197152 RepID=A0A8S1DVC3_9INSE|nr:Hypothetical predicted protein [Cloeon dipterum]